MNLFDKDLINLDGKNILITGGTGSFGKEFTRVVLKKYKVNKLIIFSRDEMKQYEMEQRFSLADYPCMRYFIGDVRDVDRLEMAMRDVDYVIHAAALKHVPAAEYNPFECINTNVYGAENIVKAAIRTNVKKVIALSTDKAANPINLYGASKLASDKIFVAANNLSGVDGAIFSVVRYGNVIGSRGSVIPYFLKLINQNTDFIPITDDRMTRFWITLDQGVSFVLSSMSMMFGGEVFVPKIPSMKITKVADYLAPSISQKNIGIRPGEKIHEIMITENDADNTIELNDRYIIKPTLSFWKEENYNDFNKQNMPSDFVYSSESNTEWLSFDEFSSLLKKSNIEIRK
jgi:UDP-N-acetylglucosamine 4,6-dehydratase/5-epimerase